MGWWWSINMVHRTYLDLHLYFHLILILSQVRRKCLLQFLNMFILDLCIIHNFSSSWCLVLCIKGEWENDIGNCLISVYTWIFDMLQNCDTFLATEYTNYNHESCRSKQKGIAFHISGSLRTERLPTNTCNVLSWYIYLYQYIQGARIQYVMTWIKT